jgi:alpha-beta hydrolase superfamily lysophospholipase
MPQTKESWRPCMEKLSQANISSLAIDQRGHGESTMRGKLFYKDFTNEQQQAKIQDGEGALDFLKKEGASEKNIFVMGASIGANLAIQMLKNHPEIKKAIALSPGLDYHGVLIEPMVINLQKNQSILIIASHDDPYAFESMQHLKQINADQVEMIEASDIGHGTSMFEKKPELIDQAIEWLKK